MKKLFLIALAIAAAPASAHIVLAPGQGTAGGYYAGAFRMSHGCDGRNTTSVRIEIPAGIVTARPQPKPGWTIEIERAPLPSALPSEGGELNERVVAITWRGELADEQFDEFGLMLKLPKDRTGPLYLPVVQRCGATDIRWDGVPAAGQAWHDVPHPAPFIEIGKAPAAHAH